MGERLLTGVDSSCTLRFFATLRLGVNSAPPEISRKDAKFRKEEMRCAASRKGQLKVT
jgi:hypothetical protein